ncbi:MAG: aspartate carbamoyltransferase [Oscillospiraceae bacterium]|nr:aspartate carbamoyltransferase [Oscillospiraceae bacterium]
MKNLNDINDLSGEQVERLIALAEDILADRAKYQDSLKHRTLATLFFEPSTRTRLSFEAAMLEMGGNVIGFADPNSSSATKGESVADTVRTVACYSDIIVMRHPKEGAPIAASLRSPVPIINAGDGGHHHPTQTLADLFTIRREKGRLDGLTIGLCGDLKFGRTVHSLIQAMSRYDGVRFALVSPEELRAPDYILEGALRRPNVSYQETDSLESVVPELDALYMTRVQRERFFNEADYVRLKDSYILTLKTLERAKRDLTILHPLPRVNEIAVEVDDDPRARYFQQMFYGKVIRKALLAAMLGVSV